MMTNKEMLADIAAGLREASWVDLTALALFLAATGLSIYWTYVLFFGDFPPEPPMRRTDYAVFALLGMTAARGFIPR